MPKTIPLSPEIVEFLNTFCDVDEIDCRIAALVKAENMLQEQAYDTGGMKDYEKGFHLYDTAYSLRGLEEELLKLKKILSDDA